jgi:hypothetical protein
VAVLTPSIKYDFLYHVFLETSEPLWHAADGDDAMRRQTGIEGPEQWIS